MEAKMENDGWVLKVVSVFDRPEAVTCSTEVDMRSVTQSLTRNVSPGALPFSSSRGQRSSSRSIQSHVAGHMMRPPSQNSRQSSSSHRTGRQQHLDPLSPTQRQDRTRTRTRTSSQHHTSTSKTPSLQHPIRLNSDSISHESQNAHSQPRWAVVTWV